MDPRYPAHLQIGHLPTPIERLERLSLHLSGPALFIKRDDQTGLALGGNKTRKLEFLAADALAQGCDHLITTGAPQSNHCRQTAAAAARLGIDCSLVLRGNAQTDLTGNLLLDRLLGANIRWAGDRPVDEVMLEVADEIRTAGHKPYTVLLGGSNALGATGYVLAMEEMMAQLNKEGLGIDYIVVPSSSGGTQAGMVLGAKMHGFSGRILGISIDHPAGKLQNKVADLATATAALLGLDFNFTGEEIEVNDDYLGQGYGILNETDRDAIRLVARLEGILLDPVYTGRAMGGLIDLIKSGAFSQEQCLLFWHTGGTPALFAYADEIF